MTSETRTDRLEELLEFRQCPFCTYDFATGEGERGCHYYDCPYVPELLDTRCPTCFYNFATDDLKPACGDPPDCEFAREVAPRRLEALAFWLAHREEGSPQ